MAMAIPAMAGLPSGCDWDGGVVVLIIIGVVDEPVLVDEDVGEDAVVVVAAGWTATMCGEFLENRDCEMEKLFLS